MGCPTSRCVLRGFNGNVLGGVLHQVVSRGGSMVMYREVCPEGVQKKYPGGGGGGGGGDGVEALCPGGIP